MRFPNLFSSDNSFRFVRPSDLESLLWGSIPKIRFYIEDFLKDKTESGIEDISKFGALDRLESASSIETILTVRNPFILKTTLHHKNSGIYIEERVTLEPGAVIKGPVIIGSFSQIRSGAYIRGDVIVGERSVIGHVSEIKSSIMMNDSAAGHFAYIGDSIIGSFVNMGAGTKIANFKFRTEDDIRNNRKKVINIHYSGDRYQTGLDKFGVLMGDYSNTGCNCVISPGCIVGIGSAIYPNVTLKPGVYAEKSIADGNA